MNQISSRAYIDIEVSKCYKINLGKTIFWQWLLKTRGEYYKKITKESENQLQKYLLSPCLLPPFG